MHVFVSFVPRQGVKPEVCNICVLPRGVSDIYVLTSQGDLSDTFLLNYINIVYLSGRGPGSPTLSRVILEAAFIGHLVRAPSATTERDPPIVRPQ